MAPKTIARIITTHLTIQHLTQDTFAELVGVSRYSINQLCNGRRSLTADMAVKLEKHLPYTAEQLMAIQAREDLRKART